MQNAQNVETTRHIIGQSRQELQTNRKHNSTVAPSVDILGENTHSSKMAEETKEIIRRAPAIPLKIEQLKENKENRIAIVGTVISKNPEIASFILDDGESKVLVITNSNQDFEKVKEGQFIRVLGKVWGEADEAEVQAEIVQDFNQLDKELYTKIFNS